MPTWIRASSLSGWTDCARRAAARLFREEMREAGFVIRPENFGVAAAIGNAVHKGAHISLAEKARTGTAAPLSVATDAARDQLSETVARGVEYETGPRGVTRTRGIAEDQALRMTRTYHQRIVPRVNPILLEERLEAEIIPGVILTGSPDQVAREPYQIRDLKTTGRLGGGNHAPQVGAYSILARSHGHRIDTVAIDEIQRVAPSNPQPPPTSQVIDVGRAELAASAIVGHIAQSLTAFREGDPTRRLLPGDPWAFVANPSSMLCAKRWCPCWGDDSETSFCLEWKRKQ